MSATQTHTKAHHTFQNLIGSDYEIDLDEEIELEEAIMRDRMEEEAQEEAEYWSNRIKADEEEKRLEAEEDEQWKLILKQQRKEQRKELEILNRISKSIDNLLTITSKPIPLVDPNWDWHQPMPSISVVIASSVV